jgi:hypothetical protein
LVELKRILLLKIAALEAENPQTSGISESTSQTAKTSIEETPEAAPLPSFAG